jgi:1,4-alpha-glucan branching enzyme
MPITEHPFYGSWGYQTTGYFAPTARYGTPQDLMYFVDHLHQRGIGVILDWVPSHFPTDAHGLAYFDGTHLYEHADPRQGFHPEWNSAIFNYGRNEVRSFLISSALFWFDNITSTACAWMPWPRCCTSTTRASGRVDPEPLRRPREPRGHRFPARAERGRLPRSSGRPMIAEESTAWPMVSRPPTMGGLGFGLKWNMGWMHDTLEYMKQDPVYRKYHHGQLTFSLIYAFNENFVLPLSHDEVVYGKGSLIGKMPGDDWQQFANLRALFGYMWGIRARSCCSWAANSGSGANGPTRASWSGGSPLPEHAGVQHWMRDLNRVYRSEPALHRVDFSPDGFEWIDVGNAEMSVIAFLRKRRRAPVWWCATSRRCRAAISWSACRARRLARDSQQRCARIRRLRMGQPGGRRSVPGERARPPRVDESDPAAAATTIMLRWEADG